MTRYRRRPEAFARHALGSSWWQKQREVAQSVAHHRRTAVKSANGVGKTYLAADLALWFLYCYQPSIVVTTAPTRRQVRHLLWEEIRRRFQGARESLPGELLKDRLTVGPGWYALGLATDEPTRFQGFHAENLLIVFDEASGIAEEIWEAAEGIAVGKNNRIVAIGNPMTASGRFYRIFQSDPLWRRHTISALDHPNVTGVGAPIPGAVTAEAIEERVMQWCEEILEGEACAESDLLRWRGRLYRPNNAFRVRVLGEFPDSAEDTLIPLRWIEAAAARWREEYRFGEGLTGVRRAAADVARFGGDWTVIGLRIGSVVARLEATQGCDLMEVAGRVARLAQEARPESIAIDGIGIGAGVADRLQELRIAGVEAVNVSLPAHDREHFANRRAELYWGLRERFRTGDITIPPDEALCSQLAQIRYTYTSRGQVQIASKEAMRRRGHASPDHADMLALLFDSSTGEGFAWDEPSSPPSAAARLRAEMEGW
jgi:phage terminase large subunit